MKKQLFTVHDSAANAFLDPFEARTVEEAIRSFREVVNKEGHQFNRFPEDYTLYHIGEFEMDTGMLVPMNPRSLGIAITFMPSQHLKAVKDA